MLIIKIWQDNNTIQYKIWDQVSVKWYIIQDDNYPTNTHTISNETTSFWLKTNSINLNNLLDKDVTIEWNIDSIDDKYPILTIKNIKDKNSKLIIHDNKYFFTNDLISFDFSQDTDITADQKDNHIEIYYQDQPVVTIETFICNKVTPTQNCEQLIYTYTDNLNEMFTTYLWYTFYKNKKNSRVTFNNQTLWYIVKTTDNEFLLSISHLINIVDSRFLAENKKALIKSNCAIDEDNTIDKITKISTQIVDQDLIKLNIDWISPSNQKINCKLTLDIRNNRKIKNSIAKATK